MPWHDLGMRVIGPSVTDLQRHFTQYWYFTLRELQLNPEDILKNF
jgi:phosphatidylserine/phosphatidylglycerophosphate/cardiolipin synthase-like enzyme